MATLVVRSPKCSFIVDDVVRDPGRLIFPIGDWPDSARTGGSNERALTLREKPVFLASGIEAMHVGFAVQNIDVFLMDAGLQ
jgi:hypothetical protein